MASLVCTPKARGKRVPAGPQRKVTSRAGNDVRGKLIENPDMVNVVNVKQKRGVACGYMVGDTPCS